MRNFQLAILTAFTITLFLVCSCKPCTPATLASAVTDTTGYYAARDLKGLGYFIIGQSTFKETVKRIKAEMRENPTEYGYEPRWNLDALKYPELKVFKKDTTVCYRDNYLYEDVLTLVMSLRMIREGKSLKNVNTNTKSYIVRENKHWQMRS